MLAAIFRRSTSFLLLKMGNLDGSRKNAARAEWELFTSLSSERRNFDALYSVVILGARSAGFGEEQVPDFLDVLAGASAFAGQEELAEFDLDAALAPTVETHRHLLGANAADTSRLLEMRVRVGQSRFARSVLANYSHACAFCGFAPGPLRAPRRRARGTGPMQPRGRDLLWGGGAGSDPASPGGRNAARRALPHLPQGERVAGSPAELTPTRTRPRNAGRPPSRHRGRRSRGGSRPRTRPAFAAGRAERGP